MTEPACLPPRKSLGPVRFPVPAAAWDTHVHAIGRFDRFPLSPRRGYTPAAVPIDDYVALMDHLGISRAVLVQPSIYATDNRAMLDALARFPERFRGVAVVPSTVGDRELRALHNAGVRGVRANLLNPGGISLDDATTLAPRFASLGWHLQLQLDVSTFDRMDEVARLPVPVVIDHLGYMPVGRKVSEPGFRRLLDWLATGGCWVKLSAPYRLSDRRHARYADVAPLARALVRANPERILWGSDWPHTDLRRDMPDDGELLDVLADWVDDPATLDAILARNPMALYHD